MRLLYLKKGPAAIGALSPLELADGLLRKPLLEGGEQDVVPALVVGLQSK
jgi:hypothetical protein